MCCVCRAVRCSTWAGDWFHRTWVRNHIVPVEDPFDVTDNCARSIFAANIGYVRGCFTKAADALRELPPESGTSTPLSCSTEACWGAKLLRANFVACRIRRLIASDQTMSGLREIACLVCTVTLSLVFTFIPSISLASLLSKTCVLLSQRI